MNGIDIYNRLKNFNLNAPDDWQLLVLIFVILFLAVKFWNITWAWLTYRKVIAKVITKDRVDYPLQVRSNYLIFTDKETFKNADSLAYWNFNSSDMYGKIEEGKTYEFAVYGKRRKWRSGYRNIVSFKEVKSPFYIIDKDQKPFKLLLDTNFYKKNDILETPEGSEVKVISTPKKYDSKLHKTLRYITFGFFFRPRKEYIVRTLEQIV